MRLTIHSALFFCVFFTNGFLNETAAQRSIGVQWEVPENREAAFNQLDQFQNLEISLLMISNNPDEEIWDEISQMGFRVYGQIPISFPLVQTFADPDSSLITTLNNFVTYYASQPTVQAIGLFKHGAVYKSAFDTTVQPYLQQIRESFSGDVYYTTSKIERAPLDNLVDFKIFEAKVSPGWDYSTLDSLSNDIAGIVYHPNKEISGLLNPFKEFLQKIDGHTVPVFVKSDWLFDMLQNKPGFTGTVQLYNSNDDFVFPAPNEPTAQTPDHSLMVLILVLVWGIFAVNHHMSPVYRKSITRYFLGHIFFVEDVMNRHIRSIGAASAILVQNVLLAGVCMYCVFSALFSPLGMQEILFYYPLLLIFNNLLLSSFLWGCILGITLTLVSIIGIRVSNSEIKSMRQVLNLYAWPIQINFIIATIMVTLLIAGAYPVIIFLLAFLFAVVHLSAFIITAIDISKYVTIKQMLFQTITIGLYSLIFIGLGIWIFNSSIPQVIRLALELS